MYFINLEKCQFTNMEPQIFSKRLNWQFLPEEFDRMANKQPCSLALHEFGSAKFGQPDTVDQMC